MNGKNGKLALPDDATIVSDWRGLPLRVSRLTAPELLLALAVAIAFADSSIVVLALPELYGDLDTSITGVAWIVTSYNVAVVVGVLALLPFEQRLKPAAVALAGRPSSSRPRSRARRPVRSLRWSPRAARRVWERRC